MTEALLEILKEQGEMKTQDFLANVPRKKGDYLDFYPVSALLHANYISTDSTTDTGGRKIDGKLGFNTHDTAVFLCQLMLPEGESFKINGCLRNSAHDFPLRIFITSEGYLRLDELEQRRIERKRKRADYIITFTVAVLAALLSSYLTHYYASRRLQMKRNQQTISSSNVSTNSNIAVQGNPK